MANEHLEVGRKPLIVCELDLDFCSNTYGNALDSPQTGTCTASDVEGSECYNTRVTCQDPNNYIRGTKTYRFCEQNSDMITGDAGIPAIVSKPDCAPAKITSGKGLGDRSNISIKLQDFPHHDRGIDPYVSTRSYVPEEQGTFFGKLLKRNPYFIGRTLRMRIGYITDPFDIDSFNSCEYILNSINGPDKNYRYSIVAKDILKLADDDKAQCPFPSTGTLSASFSGDSSPLPSSFTLLPSGIGNSEYPATNGRVRIGDELIDYSTRSGDVCSTLTRGVGNTNIETHNSDDIVQLCKVYTDENVTDILYDLLVNFSDIPASYIPTTEWDAEKDLWLAGNNLSVTISEPEGVTNLINEITEQNLVDIWWDIIQQKIRIKSISPEHLNASVPIYDESKHLMENSIIVKKDDRDRLSQVWVYYGKTNLVEDDKPEFYRYLHVSADSDAESANKYDSKKVKKFISRWIQSESLASKLASRLLNRYRDGVQRIEFMIDQKDQDISLGDSVQIDTNSVQDVDGSNDIKTYQVTFSDFFEPGSVIKLQGIEVDFFGNYIFITPDESPVIPDFSSATDEQKQTMFFIAPDSGFFSDGTPAYKII